jgi:hypothetical protein
MEMEEKADMIDVTRQWGSQNLCQPCISAYAVQYSVPTHTSTILLVKPGEK